jgi:SAM-dependent methyltransferase
MDDVRRFFDAIARTYDRDYAIPAHETRERMARVTALLGAAPKDVLVLGVGTGRELPSLLDAGHRPVGLDASEAMLAECAKRARPVPLVLASFWEPLPFEDEAFDAALALHGTLAHPRDGESVDALLRELARVLRPGGVLVFEVPSLAWLATLPEAARASKEAPLVRVGQKEAEHLDVRSGLRVRVQVWSPSEWRAAFEPAFAMEDEPLGAAGIERRLVARRRSLRARTRPSRGSR